MRIGTDPIELDIRHLEEPVTAPVLPPVLRLVALARRGRGEVREQFVARWQVALLAALLVEQRACRDLGLIERREDRWPFRRRKSLKRLRTGERFLNPAQARH